MQRFSVISLGCPKNLVDSEFICERMKVHGYEQVADTLSADIVIVNTCAFIRPAVEESIETILEVLNEGKKVICTGCLVSRYKEELLAELPEVALFAGPGTYEYMPQYLNSGKRYLEPRFGGVVLRSSISTGASAYVKVSEGCSNHCRYCLIPRLRGELKSKPPELIEKECIKLASIGVKELILIAQDLGSYGRDLGDITLETLLKQIIKIKGPEWIRLMYMHPASITKELIEMIKDEPKICPYLDMPIQHISERVLRKMGRIGGKKAVDRALELVLESNISLRTTLMVGHPGEDDDAFKELESLVTEGIFDHLGVFGFYPEEGTTSAGMRPRVPLAVIEERKQQIMSIQQEISREKLSSYRGRRLRVLLEDYADEDGFVRLGRSVFQAPDIDGVVFVNQGTATIGEFCEVEVIDSMEYDLVGRIL